MRLHEVFKLVKTVTIISTFFENAKSMQDFHNTNLNNLEKYEMNMLGNNYS